MTIEPDFHQFYQEQIDYNKAHQHQQKGYRQRHEIKNLTQRSKWSISAKRKNTGDIDCQPFIRFTLEERYGPCPNDKYDQGLRE